MKVGEKLNEYFESTGVQKKWFSTKLGMQGPHFYQILSGVRLLPQKYWKPVIEMTNGKITIKDLIEDCLKEVEGINIELISDKQSCLISLKEINKQERDCEKNLIM